MVGGDTGCWKAGQRHGNSLVVSSRIRRHLNLNGGEVYEEEESATAKQGCLITETTLYSPRQARSIIMHSCSPASLPKPMCSTKYVLCRGQREGSFGSFLSLTVKQAQQQGPWRSWRSVIQAGAAHQTLSFLRRCLENASEALYKSAPRPLNVSFQQASAVAFNRLSTSTIKQTPKMLANAPAAFFLLLSLKPHAA